MLNKLRCKIVMCTPLGHLATSTKKYFEFEKVKPELESAIEKFAGKDISESRKKELSKLMRKAWIHQIWGFDEFFLFDYEHSDSNTRKQFVSEHEMKQFSAIINNPAEARILKDKWQAYNKFKQYYNREAILIQTIEDLEKKEFSDFTTRHRNFIIKQTCLSLGKSIQIINTVDFSDAKEQMKKILTENNSAYILEELVIQSKETAVFHPQSVNTLRIPTITLNGKTEFLTPFFRMGRGKSVVDNAGAGGIFGNVDIKTGKIYAACDELGNQYTVHPDTKIPIVGFTIPHFEEALETARKLAQILPNVHYSG